MFLPPKTECHMHTHRQINMRPNKIFKHMSGLVFVMGNGFGEIELIQ